jgi:site-specific DNA-cytosine methylase
LNAFDNATESRATVVIESIYTDSRRDSIRVNEGISPTLQSQMETGGNNVPLTDVPIQITVLGFNPVDGGFGFKGDGNSETLQAHNPSGVLDNTAQVRRLTPMECERLQGFPDGWTSHRIDEKRGLIEQADSSRYRQMGNAVAVPVVEWIIERIVALEESNE